MARPDAGHLGLKQHTLHLPNRAAAVQVKKNRLQVGQLTITVLHVLAILDGPSIDHWRPVQEDASELHHSATLRQQGGEVLVQVVDASSLLGQELSYPLRLTAFGDRCPGRVADIDDLLCTQVNNTSELGNSFVDLGFGHP